MRKLSVKSKKLTIRKETIDKLSREELKKLAGGIGTLTRGPLLYGTKVI